MLCVSPMGFFWDGRETSLLETSALIWAGVLIQSPFQVVDVFSDLVFGTAHVVVESVSFPPLDVRKWVFFPPATDHFVVAFGVLTVFGVDLCPEVLGEA